MELNADDFIFHSNLVPLSVPFSVTSGANTGTSLTAGQVRMTYGPWIDTGPGSLGLQAVITVDGRSYIDYIQEYPLRTGQYQPWVNVYVEKDNSNRVRIVLKENNSDSVTHTYTQKSFAVTFHMVHIV